MSDFEPASVSAFKQVFGDAILSSGCWFHFAQAIMKFVRKHGGVQMYNADANCKLIVHCIMALPLLPSGHIANALLDIKGLIPDTCPSIQILPSLCHYVERQWITKIGTDRLSVYGNAARINNILESYHAALRRRIQVQHPNFFTFLGHLQRMTIDYMNEMSRIDSGLCIRHAKRRLSLTYETRIKTCTARLDVGMWTSLQFLKAVSHSMGAHTSSLVDHLDLSDSEVTTNDHLVTAADITSNGDSNSSTTTHVDADSKSQQDSTVEENYYCGLLTMD